MEVVCGCPMALLGLAQDECRHPRVLTGLVKAGINAHDFSQLSDHDHRYAGVCSSMIYGHEPQLDDAFVTALHWPIVSPMVEAVSTPPHLFVRRRRYTGIFS